MGEIDAVIKSGHRVKDAYKLDVSGISGHGSGHGCAIDANSFKTNNQSGQ